MSVVWLVIGGGAAASAALFLAITVGSLATLVLTYMAPLPLFLIGLSLGGPQAGVAGALAALLIYATNGSASAILYFLSCALPVSLIADKALTSHPGSAAGKTHWYPPGLLCLWLPAIPVSVLILSYLYFMVTGSGLEAAIAPQIRGLMEAYRAALGVGAPNVTALEPQQLALIETLLVNIAPALVALIWMLVTLLNGATAQAVLTRFGRNLRPAPRLADIELPRWLVGLFAAAFLAGITISQSIGFLGANLAAILAFPIFLSGLGVVHAAAGKTRFRFGLLFMLYTILVISRWGSVAMVVLGLIDHFINLKSRMRGGTPSV